ncbi:MAG: response regulator [Planctomycetota bacterium]|jgi:two-component system chemotaxis response regulator CheY
MAKSLLVVDDSATMRKIITRTIRKAGLSVDDEIQEAGNGSEALDKLGESPVDVVLCDINMPEMNGLEFIKKAREMDSCSDTKIVMISTESSDEIISGAKADGADGFITKPFTPEKIEKELAPFLA